MNKENLKYFYKIRLPSLFFLLFLLFRDFLKKNGYDFWLWIKFSNGRHLLIFYCSVSCKILDNRKTSKMFIFFEKQMNVNVFHRGNVYPSYLIFVFLLKKWLLSWEKLRRSQIEFLKAFNSFYLNNYIFGRVKKSYHNVLSIIVRVLIFFPKWYFYQNFSDFYYIQRNWRFLVFKKI